jgi:hypothetical protein
MHYNEVTNSIYIGEFLLRKDKSRNFIEMNYKVQKDTLKNEDGRVYLICSDGIIKKIGGSQSKGGIQATMSFYVNSMTGSPGKPRYIVHLLIRDELLKGKQCTLHMITSPKVISHVNGLYSKETIEVAAFKEMENLCKKDYFKKMRRYPDWNFQENTDDYPKEYSILHVKYHENRLKDKS